MRSATTAAAAVLAALPLAPASAVAAAAPVTQVRSFLLNAPLQQVMPLFTAAGERDWAPGWEPEFLSGAVERGSAFITRAHGVATTWIVVDYRPEQGRVSYARLAHGSNIGLVDVTCTGQGDATQVSVRYTLTAITEEGRAFVRDFLEPERYTRMIDEWQAATSAALAKRAAAQR